MKKRSKFILLTTVPISLNFFRNQINKLNEIYEVTLVSSPSLLLDEIANEENVNFKAIKMNRNISLINDVRSLINLVLYFLSEKPNIIHCNTPKASLLGLLAGFLTKVPHRIYYIHGLRYQGAKGFKRKLLKGMEKAACFFATDLIAVSNGIKITAHEELTNKTIEVIHNGSVNGMFISEYINARYNKAIIQEELCISDDDFVFGFIGRLVGDKGINELVSSFEELNQINKKIKLILVGPYEDDLDPLENSTKLIIKKNPNIIEAGFQKDVKKYLSLMNVFVSPSYREGFGLSLLEANLMGIPIIASRITGYEEIIKEDKNGFLIPPKNKEALQSKMAEVFLQQNKLCEMKEFCINNVVEKYNHEDVLREAINYYQSISISN
ncbi:glycosyltransferase [Chryseobacterium sp. RR2-3-20]|uniref:glycosyltransferase n=1 Tax=Chryseobacterium sp. RR2-3-20 TaxID=2787626 RepID=UPI001AE03BB6|nr:glycosyltransferase [Chryseobacterium sp. RR2-3-20]